MAGLLVAPRFRWSALGEVYTAIGFVVSPTLGGLPPVPGSAREVPPWLLAAEVLGRIAAALGERRRGFPEREELRPSPRGGIRWGRWASEQLPRGDWARFPCRYSEPGEDPQLLAGLRWTLGRLRESLSEVAWSTPSRILLERARRLAHRIGPGPEERPAPDWRLPLAGERLRAALEAMGWVAEERGLGGSRALDGLAWDVSVDAVWEAWVVAFGRELGPRLGLVPSEFRSVRRPLRWQGAARSMGFLAPDLELRGRDRIVWIDAKYKAHLSRLARGGWESLAPDEAAAHRADLHQALAYAALADAPRVDSILAYPELGSGEAMLRSVATVVSGRRIVRLALASLPFGFRSAAHREHSLADWRELLSD
ncbi:MAG: hypothetical protein RML12_10015 [Xanthomonadales bacterium]|nr:hypothetical protein [Xanthomonadales bacterium]